MHDWTQRISFPKVVRGLKQNGFRIAYAQFPEILCEHRLTGIPVEIEFLSGHGIWTASFNSCFANWNDASLNPVPGFGAILGPLDDGRWVLDSSAFPSKVVGAVKHQMKRFQDDRSWSAKWNWRWEKNHGRED